MCEHGGTSLGKSLAVSCKGRQHSPYDSAPPLLGIRPREIKTYSTEKTYTKTFTAAFIIIAENWRQPNYPSTGVWMNKLRYFCAMEYELLKRGRGEKEWQEDEEEKEGREKQKTHATALKTAILEKEARHERIHTV